MATSGAGLERATGWRPTQPLTGQRCRTRAAFEAARDRVVAGRSVAMHRTIGEFGCTDLNIFSRAALSATFG